MLVDTISEIALILIRSSAYLTVGATIDRRLDLLPHPPEALDSDLDNNLELYFHNTLVTRLEVCSRPQALGRVLSI